jgi:hypothetical protein
LRDDKPQRLSSKGFWRHDGMHVDIAMSANMHLGECHGVLCSSELAHGTKSPLEWRRHGDSIGREARRTAVVVGSVTCTCASSGGAGSVRRDSQDENTQDMLPNWQRSILVHLQGNG